MRRIERYILGFFLKIFFILLVSLFMVIAVTGFIEKYPDISGYSPSFFKVLTYILYTLPDYGGYLLPMVSLLSIIYVLGIASRNKEILIISASGGRLREVFKPLVVAGIVISIISGIFTNILMPASKSLSRKVLEEITREPQLRGLLESPQGIWFRSEDKIIRIGIYEPLRSEARDIGIYELSGGSLIRRIEAREGTLGEKEWNLRDVKVYTWRGEGGAIHYRQFNLRTSRYALRLLKTGLSPEEMDSAKLWRYIRALKKSGLRNIKIVADFNLRLSLPFASIAMVLLGIYLGSSRALSGLMGAGIAIAISIFFWFSTTFMLSLAYSGVLPPWLSPWIIPLIALATGIYLYRRIE